MVTEKEKGPDPLRIEHPWGLPQQRKLAALGVPFNSVLRKGQGWELEDAATTVRCQLDKAPIKSVRKKDQIDRYLRIYQNPLRGSYLYVVASAPSDARAKQLGLVLFNQALQAYNNRPKGGRQQPRWVSVYGGYEKGWPQVADNPSMLVVGNVVAGATQVKLEKLRDLLEFYNDRPRIVLTSGHCPLAFALQTLRVSPNAVMQLEPADRVTAV